MKVSVLFKDERKLVIEVDGEDHTLGNLLAKEAIRHPGVEYAAYRVPHPLKNSFEFTIIAKPGYNVSILLKEVVEGLKSTLSGVRRLFEERIVE
ncbi:MAG: DNA-directed RNA polymerase subunit L [Desulfurococcus sp.]|nr:DNA-directed RNA polymerase subunit L [Desulfurococcus sp.]